MSSIHDAIKSDLAHILSSGGEPFLFYPHGVEANSVSISGIINRNAEKPPTQYGYSNAQSGKHHEINFASNDLPNTPKRDDTLKFDNTLFIVHHVLPAELDARITLYVTEKNATQNP